MFIRIDKKLPSSYSNIYVQFDAHLPPPFINMCHVSRIFI